MDLSNKNLIAENQEKGVGTGMMIEVNEVICFSWRGSAII